MNQGRGLPGVPPASDMLLAEAIPSHVFLPKGMIVPEEQVLFYLLSKVRFRGAGKIIDAGAFCGSSAYAFAAGLADNGGLFDRSRLIYSYDLFVADDEYTQDYIQNNFYYFTDLQGARTFRKLEIQPGYSFREIFDFQTQRYSDWIVCNEGSILDRAWNGGPIEILCIDVAKTLEIQQHVFAQFVGALIPEQGILIQQDFHHAYHPYIHVAMEYLSDYFEITHSRVGASRAYRLLKSIPAHDLARVVTYDFSAHEVDLLMQATIKKSPEIERPLLGVIHARHLMLIGEVDRLSEVVEDFYVRWSGIQRFDWYVNEMSQAAGPQAKEILEALMVSNESACPQ